VSGYLTPIAPCTGELEVKRSRFITYLNRANNRDQALAYLANIRQQHPQARHVCWAYIAGPPDTTVRSMSDDGEPSGTAGRPMLAALEHSGLGEVVVAVVRYFGGVKLGTGGLQRAYSEAVTSVLATCATELKRALSVCEFELDFQDEAVLRHLLAGVEGEVVHAEYATRVRMLVTLPNNNFEQLQRELAAMTAGRAVLVANSS